MKLRKKTNFVKILFLQALFMFMVWAIGEAQNPLWEDISGTQSYTMLCEGAGGRIFAGLGLFFPQNPVYGVYYSTDGGETWVKTSLDQDIDEVEGQNANLIVARYTYSGVYQLYYSTNNGQNWLQTNAFENYAPVFMNISDSGHVFGYDSSPRKILRYVTSNRRWAELGFPVPFSLSGNNVSAFRLDHKNTFLLGSAVEGLFISRNYGTTWEKTLTNRAVGDILVSKENTIFVATSPLDETPGGVFTSSDTGKSWLNIGLPLRVINHLALDTSGTIFASTDNGIYRYKGNPNQWEPLGPVAALFDDFIITKSNQLLLTGASNGFYRSDDLGNSWKKTTSVKGEIVSGQCADSKGNFYLGTLGNGIFISRNSGVNWSQVPSKDVCCEVYSFMVNDSAILAGTDNGIYRTSDDGITWSNSSVTSFTGIVYSLVKDGGGTLYAGTSIGVFRSTDGGTTWQQAGLSTQSAFGIAISNTGKLFAATGFDGIYTSSNNGVTWNYHGYADDDIRAIVSTPQGNVFAGGYGTIYRTSNEGASWESFVIDGTYVLSLTSRGWDNIFAGTSNGVFSSTNAGSTWTKMSSNGLSQSVVLSLGFNENGNLIAGTYQGGVYRAKQTITDVTENETLPEEFQLYQNYPNPFNPITEIRYAISTNSHVKLTVYDVLGREITTLVDEVQGIGIKTVHWDASSLTSGVYYYRLQAGNMVETKKMLLLK